jgi:hypothetical protein
VALGAQASTVCQHRGSKWEVDVLALEQDGHATCPGVSDRVRVPGVSLSSSFWTGKLMDKLFDSGSIWEELRTIGLAFASVSVRSNSTLRIVAPEAHELNEGTCGCVPWGGLVGSVGRWRGTEAVGALHLQS